MQIQVNFYSNYSNIYKRKHIRIFCWQSICCVHSSVGILYHMKCIYHNTVVHHQLNAIFLFVVNLGYLIGRLGYCLVGLTYGRATVWDGKCPSGFFPSGNCLLWICPREVSIGLLSSGATVLEPLWEHKTQWWQSNSFTYIASKA